MIGKDIVIGTLWWFLHCSHQDIPGQRVEEDQDITIILSL